MALNGVLTRLLSDPTSLERDVLSAEDELDQEEKSDDAAQTSFFHALQDDLEASVIRISKNTDQKLIVVTQDKALLTLKKHMGMLGRKDWVAPLSTFITILVALITSDFKTALGLSQAEWRAMFIVAAFITAGWLSLAIKKALYAKGFSEVIRDIIYGLGAQKRYVREEVTL